MITFISSLILLVLGYLLYGRFVERVFGANPKRPTPAEVNPDGVDYVAMPWWRIFLIQFLNIAGLGPIFGAIMGVMFGPAAFLWIVFGSIFGGAVHDYLSGMLSVRRNGASLPEIVGAELGNGVKQFMRGFTLILMVLVGAVFVSGPAGLLNGMFGTVSMTWWLIIIFAYYMLATLLPIDKLIGRIYPIFGAALLFMAVGILVALFINNAPIPELTDGLYSHHPKEYPIFPMMFVSIACGAISGFHATQSPMMARCLTNEKYGRPHFKISLPLIFIITGSDSADKVPQIVDPRRSVDNKNFDFIIIYCFIIILFYYNGSNIKKLCQSIVPINKKHHKSETQIYDAYNILKKSYSPLL